MTFIQSGIQRLVSYSQRENTAKELFQRIQGKPFWIWNVEEHKQEDVKTDGDCWLSHTLGRCSLAFIRPWHLFVRDIVIAGFKVALINSRVCNRGRKTTR